MRAKALCVIDSLAVWRLLLRSRLRNFSEMSGQLRWLRPPWPESSLVMERNSSDEDMMQPIHIGECLDTLDTVWMHCQEMLMLKCWLIGGSSWGILAFQTIKDRNFAWALCGLNLESLGGQDRARKSEQVGKGARLFSHFLNLQLSTWISFLSSNPRVPLRFPFSRLRILDKLLQHGDHLASCICHQQ